MLRSHTWKSLRFNHIGRKMLNFSSWKNLIFVRLNKSQLFILSLLQLIEKIVRRTYLHQWNCLTNAVIFWKIVITQTRNQESNIWMIQHLLNYQLCLLKSRWFRKSKRINLKGQMTRITSTLKLRIPTLKFLIKVEIKISILIIYSLRLLLTHKEKDFLFHLFSHKETNSALLASLKKKFHLISAFKIFLCSSWKAPKWIHLFLLKIYLNSFATILTEMF